jgi:predicted Fe-Mo cluster-binding NifX family protein
MKIAVSSTGRDLKAQIDPRFGRCRYFVVVDPDGMSFEVFDNDSAGLRGGAGIQAAQFLSGQGVECVITGNCGPNAVDTLNATGIKLFCGQSGTVADAVQQYKDGHLAPSTASNVPLHAGSGGAGFGRGMGGGGGRGRGMGGGGFGRGRNR